MPSLFYYAFRRFLINSTWHPHFSPSLHPMPFIPLLGFLAAGMSPKRSEKYDRMFFLYTVFTLLKKRIVICER